LLSRVAQHPEERRIDIDVDVDVMNGAVERAGDARIAALSGLLWNPPTTAEFAAVARRISADGAIGRN
jgi:hypothetical protein